jgi:hypothetical protein
MAEGPIPKIKAALLVDARRQIEFEYALSVLKEVVPNVPIPSEVFELNNKIDKILMEPADKHNVDVPEPQDREAPHLFINRVSRLKLGVRAIYNR